MSMTNKDFRARARIGTQLAVAAAAAALLSAPEVRAQTVYNVAGIADFTGPYADVMKDLAGCRKTVFDWWNEEVGKPAGVALRIKDFDGRYDVAQISSLWPGMKSELNPVAALGLGEDLSVQSQFCEPGGHRPRGAVHFRFVVGA